MGRYVIIVITNTYWTGGLIPGAKPVLAHILIGALLDGRGDMVEEVGDAVRGDHLGSPLVSSRGVLLCQAGSLRGQPLPWGIVGWAEVRHKVQGLVIEFNAALEVGEFLLKGEANRVKVPEVCL